MKNNYKRIIKLFAWLSLALFVIRTLITINDVLDMISSTKVWELVYNFIGYAGEAVSVATLFLLVYNKFLWRVLNFWKIPVLAKEYKGTFVSSVDGKERDAELFVKQTFLSIKIKMRTSESWSISICENLHIQNGVNILTYTYINRPELRLYERSKIHCGTVSFDCDHQNYLQGDYYTDRKTSGSMTFVAKKRENSY